MKQNLRSNKLLTISIYFFEDFDKT